METSQCGGPLQIADLKCRPMDVHDRATRSRNMSAIRSKNTEPELFVRRVICGLGHRYRLDRKDLPGTPDIAFIGKRKAIFVHGCFWHRHPKCRYTTSPSTNKEFWQNKFEKNVARDRKVRELFRIMKWKVLTIWECELSNRDKLKKRIKIFLEL